MDDDDDDDEPLDEVRELLDDDFNGLELADDDDDDFNGDELLLLTELLDSLDDPELPCDELRLDVVDDEPDELCSTHV